MISAFQQANKLPTSTQDKEDDYSVSITMQEDETVHLTYKMGQCVLSSIVDSVNGNMSRELSVFISKARIDHKMTSTFVDDTVVMLGTHHFYLYKHKISKERMRLEFTALCVLADIAFDYCVAHPQLTKVQRCHTVNSFTACISYNAFRKFQCLVEGLTLAKKALLYSKCSLKALQVETEDYDVVRYPSEEDKDWLATCTRFTNDVCRAMKATKQQQADGIFMIDTSTCVIPTANVLFLEQSHDC